MASPSSSTRTVVADHLLEPQVLDLDVCSAYYRQCRSGVDVQPNRGRLYPGLWQTPELPSTQWRRGCQRAVLPSGELVATICFVQALIRCFLCKIMRPLTDFFIVCLPPNPRQQGRARHLDGACHSNRHPTRGLSNEEPTPLSSWFFRSCASGRDIFEHSFMVANVMSGRSWDK